MPLAINTTLHTVVVCPRVTVNRDRNEEQHCQSECLGEGVMYKAGNTHLDVCH